MFVLSSLILSHELELDFVEQYDLILYFFTSSVKQNNLETLNDILPHSEEDETRNDDKEFFQKRYLAAKYLGRVKKMRYFLWETHVKTRMILGNVNGLKVDS